MTQHAENLFNNFLSVNINGILDPYLSNKGYWFYSYNGFKVKFTPYFSLCQQVHVLILLKGKYDQGAISFNGSIEVIRPEMCVEIH